MSGAMYYDCPCGARFHESEMPDHWRHLADRVEELEAVLYIEPASAREAKVKRMGRDEGYGEA